MAASAPLAATKHIVMQPIGSGPTSQATADVASTIAGSFMAVPPNQGKPTTILQTSIRQRAERAVEFEVRAMTLIGEIVSGADVNFDTDREESKGLNGGRKLVAATGFEFGVVKTNENGIALGNLVIASIEPAGTKISIVIGMFGRSEEIIYEYGG